MGRPKIKIDYELVEKLASVGNTESQIAIVFDCSIRTLQRDKEFCRSYKKGLNRMQMSLRGYQFKQAEHNPTMAIWLGKQYLGQKDVVDTNVNISEDDPLTKAIKSSIDDIDMEEDNDEED